MFLNAGYFRGMSGSLSHYALFGYRFLFSSRKSQVLEMSKLKTLLVSENPDICCIAEVDLGSLDNGNVNQIKHLSSTQYKYFNAENKYALDSRLKSNHFFRGKSNGFLSKEDLSFRKVYFENGTKRLVRIITYKDINIFLVHLSLLKRVRARQLEQLKEFVHGLDKVVVCGDFNMFHGLPEVEELLKDARLVLVNHPDHKTYPSSRPQHAIDLFMCSKNIAPFANVRVLGEHKFSDHLPVVFELSPKV